MSTFQEYDQFDGTGLGELIQKKEILPTEVFDEAMRRAKAINPHINAIIRPMFQERPLSHHNSFPGPFYGIPLLLKDTLHDVKGLPTSKGSKAFHHFPALQDSEMVRRFKKAGLVFLGKTNMPEFGLMGITEPKAFGPTKNPWNLKFSPGGSSGGSAAAVASGIVPIASASDGGGSIRIPASACGLFGLKPSRGRTPSGPSHGEVWDGATGQHVITRTVRDSALCLDATHGPDLGAPYFLPPPERSYISEANSDPRPLKIAFSCQSPLGNKVHGDCEKAVHSTIKLLEELGHHVEEATPKYDGELLARSFLAMYCGQMASELKRAKTSFGRRWVTKNTELTSQTLALIGNSMSAGEYVSYKKSWNQFSRTMGEFHQRYDIFITPTQAAPPPQIGELQLKSSEKLLMSVVNFLKAGNLLLKTGIVDQIAKKNLEKSPFTQLANLTGQPAMSMPLYWNDDDLPIGIQFMAPLGDESTLFSLAFQMERARNWFTRRPALSYFSH